MRPPPARAATWKAGSRPGDNLILFPEGTSSDGSRVLPFHSTFFVLAKPPARPDAPPVPLDRMPLIQPISVVYDRLGGMPVGRNARPVFAWFGDMDLARHAWKLAQCRGMRATVLLHEPIDPAEYPSRRALADAAWVACAEGAAALRQKPPGGACGGASAGETRTCAGVSAAGLRLSEEGSASQAVPNAPT